MITKDNTVAAFDRLAFVVYVIHELENVDRNAFLAQSDFAAESFELAEFSRVCQAQGGLVLLRVTGNGRLVCFGHSKWDRGMAPVGYCLSVSQFH